MHKTCLIQLPHAGIHHGIAGFTLTPSFKFPFIISPNDIIKFWLEIFSDNTWKAEKNLHEKFAPDQFPKKYRILSQGKINDLPDAYGSESEMRSQVAGFVNGRIIPLQIVFRDYRQVIWPYSDWTDRKAQFFNRREFTFKRKESVFENGIEIRKRKILFLFT